MSVRAASTPPPPVLTSPAKAEQSRQHTEDRLNELFSRAMRQFLARMEKELRARVNAGQTVLTAASERLGMIGLGTVHGWWQDTVDRIVLAEVLAAWRSAYSELAGDLPESAVRVAAEEYLPRVRDRLVRGDVYIGGRLAPSVAEDSFDKARVLLARSAAEGWSRPRTAQRIASEFGWETNGSALRDELATINTQIDDLLDPLGHPGTPAREYARLHDPHIAALQEDRAQLIKQLDAEKSYWQNRAQLIARTESTSLHGVAANSALKQEGFTFKQWVATNDARTRKEHVEADGQVVPVDAPFMVGGFAMQYPGDPSAPVGSIANCRCTVISADDPDEEAPTDEFSDTDKETGQPPPATPSSGDSGGGSQLPPRRGMLGPEGPDEFGTFDGWKPPLGRSEIDSFEEVDAYSVLHGDGSGHGGHAWDAEGAPTKSRFPQGWHEAEVMAWVQAIIDRPADAFDDGDGVSFFGNHEGVAGVLRVRRVIGTPHWQIRTGHPMDAVEWAYERGGLG